MKRFFVLLLSLAMLLSIVACAKNGSVVVYSDNLGTSSSPHYYFSETPEIEVELNNTFKDEDACIAFDYPDLTCIEEGDSHIFKNDKFTIVYCHSTVSRRCELKDIPSKLWEKFYNATEAHLFAPCDSIFIDKVSDIISPGEDYFQINGYIVVKQGDGTSVSLPMQGYTFMTNDSICELIAVLTEGSNEAAQIEMEQTVVAMLESLRSLK